MNDLSLGKFITKLDRELVIGSRGSHLALWQANYFKKLLNQSGWKANIKIIKTKGDKIQNVSFDKIEGKGFFTSELENELLEESIDIAVHSLKDLPTSMVNRLTIGGVSQREDPADCLCIKKSSVNKSKPFWVAESSRIGTSSSRRCAQLNQFLPNITVVPIRGNVPTRIKKLLETDLDAIVLAKAGLNRLSIDPGDDFIVKRLHPREFIPSPGQGVLGYQCREEDTELVTLLQSITDDHTSEVVQIERKILEGIEGGCQTPIGIYCEIDNLFNYHVWAFIELEPGNYKQIKVSMNSKTDIISTVVDQLKSK